MAYDGIARGIAGKALVKIKDVALAGGFTVEIVPTLPTTDISSHKIYFMLNDNNTYDEYMYIDGSWEKIGSTSINLSDYYTKEEVDDLLDADLLEIKLPFYGHAATEIPTSINLDESSWDNVISVNADMNNGDYPNVLVTFYAGDTGFPAEVGTTVYQAVVKPKQFIFEVDNTPVGVFTLDATAVVGNDSVQISIFAYDLTSADRTVAFSQKSYYSKDEVDDDINTVSQGIINVTASIDAINEDISTVNDELDEIDGQINDINEALDTNDGIIENLIDGQTSLTADIEMYKQKVVRDGETTFLAVDNTDYQWTTNQTALAVTLPTPTDLTRTHVINLNFIAGSSSPLSLFGNFNTPVDWAFVEGCLYQIKLKYIETAWEIKQYCPEKEYASADDLDDKIDIPAVVQDSSTAATIADLQDNTKYLYSNYITSLTITASSQTLAGGESTIYCGTGNSITFSYPTDLKVIGSDELKPNKMYVISIDANIMVVGEVN